MLATYRAGNPDSDEGAGGGEPGAGETDGQGWDAERRRVSHRQGKAVDRVSHRGGGEAEHRRHCAKVIQAHDEIKG